MERPTFASLGLSPEILKAVDKLGFEEASPIQAAAIPELLAGRDVVGQSQTGSGKTAAFAIPAIEKTDPALHAVQVLVLCPTRELATQVAGEVHKLSAGKRGVHAVPVYGGSSFERQAQELKRGAQIVLGTPGRIIDHLERGTLKLDRLRFIVLDEADRMLDMGFRDDIKRILDAMPADRQTAFFSATVSPAIRKLIDRYARDPVTLKIDQKKVDAPDITQWYYETPPRMKFDALLRLIDFHTYRSGIIFCNTQRTVDELADDLQAQGIPSDRLHGGIAQAQRTRVMNKFKAGGFDFLVATDVAGRGIDVDDLELVVNFDLPYDPEDYVHRIGRTGRAGKQGVAISLVTGRDVHKIRFLEKVHPFDHPSRKISHRGRNRREAHRCAPRARAADDRVGQRAGADGSCRSSVGGGRGFNRSGRGSLSHSRRRRGLRAGGATGGVREVGARARNVHGGSCPDPGRTAAQTEAGPSMAAGGTGARCGEQSARHRRFTGRSGGTARTGGGLHCLGCRCELRGGSLRFHQRSVAFGQCAARLARRGHHLAGGGSDEEEAAEPEEVRRGTRLASGGF